MSRESMKMLNVKKRVKSAVAKAVSNNLTKVSCVEYTDSSINRSCSLPNYEFLRVVYEVPSASVEKLKKSAVLQNDLMEIESCYGI